jgi:excisionase family DNA binding protein
MTGQRKTRGRRASSEEPRTRPPGNGADEWLTVDEACRIVKIGRRTFERYLSRGIGPRVKRMGKSRNSPIRIRRDWLDEWMEDGAA